MEAENNIPVDAGDIIIFFDRRFPPDPGTGTKDNPAVNRVAVVVGPEGALFVGRGQLLKKVEILPLGRIEAERNASIRKSPYSQHADSIVSYFKKHIDNVSHFEAGLKALYFGNLQPLLAGSLFPSQPPYQSEAEFDAAWKFLKSSLRPMDTIYTVDQGNLISRFIAWSTHGPWSHVAVHVNEGQIWESVLSGIRTVPNEAYKDRQHWVGLYRRIENMDNHITAEQAEAAVRSHKFKPNRYNYRGALKFGFKAFLGDHSHALVPNSQIYQGTYVLIAQA